VDSQEKLMQEHKKQNGVPERQKSSDLKIAAFETQAFLAGITFAIYLLITRPDLNDFLSRP